MSVKYFVFSLFLCLFCFLAGGLAFGFYQKNYKKADCSCQKEKTETLNSQAQKQIACAPCPSKIPAPPFSPAVVFDPPGIFSQEEKTKLYNLLINPFLDYYNENETQYIAILIKKYKPQESHLDYDYEVLAIHKNSSTQGFLYSSKQFWFPDCMGGPCSFSPSYQTKYPEVVKLNNSGI